MPDGEFKQESLTVERLGSGDRPSILILGMAGAQALKKHGVVVFMADVLGYVHIVPADMIRVTFAPKVDEEILDQLDEDLAIEVLVRQRDEEATIFEYLDRRKTRRDTHANAGLRQDAVQADGVSPSGAEVLEES